MSTAQGRARIEFEADATAVSDELIAKMAHALDRIAATFEKSFARMESEAQSRMGGAGRAAEDAGDRATRAAQQAERASANTSSGYQAWGRAASKAGDSAMGAGESAATGARRGADATAGLGAAMDRAGRAATNAGAAASSSMGGTARAAQAAATSASRAGDSAGAAAGKMSQVGSSGRAGFDGASSAAQGLIGKLGGITIALGAVMGPMAMLKGGFDRLMSKQRAEIMFKNIGMSAEETSAQMDRLTEQVTGTSVSLADAAKYSAMFAQAGVKLGAPMDDAIKAFTNLSAAATGTGVDVGRVLQQVAASGKIDAGVLNQLSDAGVNAADYLSKTTGQTVAEVRKLASEGKISFEDLVGAVNAGMGSFAEDMGQTLPAKMANFRTAVSSLGETLIDPFIGPITKSVEFGISMLKNVRTPINQMKTWFTEGGAAADVLKVALAAIGSAMVVGSIVGMVTQLGLVAKVAGLASKAVGLLNLAFLTSGPGILVMAIAGLVAGIVVLWNRSEGFRNFFTGMWDGIVSKVTGVVDTLKAAWSELTAVFTGGDEGYGALSSLIGEGAAKWVMDTLDNVKTAWGELTAAFRGGDDGYGALAALIGEDAAEWAVNTLANVRVAWDEIVTAFRGGDDGYGALAALIGEDAAEWAITVIGNVKAAWGELTTAFSGGDDGYGALAAIIGEDAAEWAVNAIASVKTAWTELTTAFTGGDDGYGALAQIFGEAGAEYITTAVATLGDGVRTLGEWIGFAWGKVTELGASLGGAVWETAKSLFSALVDVGSALFGAFLEIGKAVWGLIQVLQPILIPILKVVGAIIGVTLYVAIQAIIGAFKLAAGVVQTLAGVISWLASNVLSPLIGLLGRVAAALIDKVAAGLTTVVEWVGKVTSFVGDMGGKIVGAFSSAGSWLFNAGRDIVTGLLDGIKSLAGTIGSFFLDLMPGWIQTPFKKALGIASPSKVFAGFGGDIGQGLINGLQAMQGKVEGALGGITQTATAVGEELRDAFHGGDSGYAALGTVIGDDLARSAVNATAGAGATVATVGAAGEEVGAAFAGRDMGYAATGALIGDDTAVAALDVSEQIGGAFAAAGAGIDAAKAGVIDPALAGMSANLSSLGTAAAEQGLAVTTALTTAGAGVLNAKTTLVDPALAGMQAGLAQTAATTQQQMLGMALPAMQQAGAGVAAVQTGTVDPALAAMRGAIGNTASATAVGAANINTEWNKVREGTAAPVRFTISSVFNDGLVGMWNGVADMIGAKKMNPYPVKFASGTSHIGSVLPGYTPGVDPFTFIEPRTGMSIGLGGGEGIARPEVVRALGPDRFDNLNAAARMGGVNAVRRHLGQFAGGGVIGSITGLVNKYFPGMSITSTYRPGDPGHHGSGNAVDFSNGTDTTPQMQAAARFFHQNYAKGLLELIHWPLNGWQNIKNGAPLNYGEPTNSQHRNHVHVAAARPLPPPGGLVVPVPSGAGAAPIDWAAMVGEMLKPDADAIRGRIGGTTFPGIVGEVPGKTFDAMLKPMQATITKKMEESGGSMGDGGGGAEQWRGLAMQALARHGYNPAQHIDAMLKQIQIESGGVPNAINNWDSNAAKGTPSGGLLQVIEPTYRRVRNAYPEAFTGLPDNHMIPATNLVAGVGAVRMDWGGPQGRWPTTAGYDNGGVAFGEGLLAKKIVEPERVLNARQTKAFEAWMAAGQRFDEINALVASVQAMRLDRPEVMADDIARRVSEWIGPEPAEGSLRALAAALSSGVEWERVTQGMARSAEAWANGDWVQVAEDKRLATPDEMRRQVEGNFLSEIADELGGLIGLKGLVKAPEIVGESGLVTLPKDTADTLAAAVSTPDGATTVAVPTGATVGDELTNVTRITGNAGTASGGETSGGEKVTQVDITVNVNGTTDPMAVGDQVVSRITRGLETAIGGTVRSK